MSTTSALVDAARPPPSQAALLLTSLSRLLGWTYTLAWSLSFYPQVIANYVNSSTVGLSTDFVILNTVGHASYLGYNSLLLFSTKVRKEYRKQHDGHENVAQLNDWVFSLHATLLALVTLAQYLRYRTESQEPSRTTRLLLAGILTAYVTGAGAKLVRLIRWIDIVSLLATVKLLITVVKYIPQIKLNADRKSTSGFSIENILLDLTGGVLSLGQLFLDAGIQADWSAVLGDPGKLGLSLLTLGFDAILIVQHYCIYPASSHADQDADESSGTAAGQPSDSTFAFLQRWRRGGAKRARSGGVDERTALLSSSSSFAA
ncbi:PQ-loop-domain-containing protein [Testicularia cyperi]|uniref:PQ-loop-domain-containing protein n=1 Tax=Testicularia cyperi TaxID=1882483 RepID=A0A317XVV2_9BASI|nr:PQ-loop-domain-containing protein [Testicularia cyperi]